jgi:hypothetical protein
MSKSLREIVLRVTGEEIAIRSGMTVRFTLEGRIKLRSDNLPANVHGNSNADP